MKKCAAFLTLSILFLLTMLSAVGDEGETMTLRIIATSDLHGKFMPWDYALDAESRSGSMVQLATAIEQYRTEDTILVDAGDSIQDNLADIFVDDETVHPMIQAINMIGYDVCVVGNHDFDYGMDAVNKLIRDYDCTVVAGNVYDMEGNPIADGFKILEKNGIRIAVIGMVTPNIIWSQITNRKRGIVTDPLEETRKIIDKIQGQYDVLVGVFHMGIENEFGLSNSGVTDILMACPEFDVMVSAHEHKLIGGKEINGVLTVQNKNRAETMMVIDLTMERDGENWKVTDRTSQVVAVKDFEENPEMKEMLLKYHDQARQMASQVIGRLEGGALAPPTKSGELPAALVQDTALIDLINDVQMHYAGTKVSAAALCSKNANLYPGEIHKRDTALIYKYPNTLCKMRMTGSQLKKFMEWSASSFETVPRGVKQVSLRERVEINDYIMFAGVRYEVNLSREPGSRIEHLTWMDGTPVKDDDMFSIAVDNYCADSRLQVPGMLYDVDDMPVLVEKEIGSEIGTIRELIGDYIVNVKKGLIYPECDENWRITGLE